MISGQLSTAFFYKSYLTENPGHASRNVMWRTRRPKSNPLCRSFDYTFPSNTLLEVSPELENECQWRRRTWKWRSVIITSLGRRHIADILNCITSSWSRPSRIQGWSVPLRMHHRSSQNVHFIYRR